MHVPAGRRLERLPVLILSVLGLVLTVGVLAVTSKTELQDAPSWYPSGRSLAAPAVDTSSAATATTVTAPLSSIGPEGSTIGREPATKPMSEESPSAATGGSEAAATPGWRLVATLPAYRGALSGLEVVKGGGTETFVAAGADEHGPLVLAASEADVWRALPREGLPPDGYARTVAATQDAVIVAGADGTGPSVWELVGDSWRRGPVAGADEGRVVFADLAVREDTWVLVGFDGGNTGFWVRPSGSERFAVVPSGAVTGVTAEQMLVREVVAIDSGFVAVGQADGRAVRWWSKDGIDWAGEPLFAGEGATAMGLASDGKTIVGYDGAGGVVWTERQGQWNLVRLPAPAEAPQTAARVASRSGHTVVLGLEAGRVSCWETHDDGRPPARCPDSAALHLASSVGAVAAHGDGLLSVGQVHASGSKVGPVGVWALSVE